MYRDNTSQVWRLKKNFGMVNGQHIGPVNVSLGTTSERDAAAIEASILTLPDNEGESLLVELKNRIRSPLEIHRLVQSQKLKKYPKLADAESMSDALNNWIEKATKRDGRPLSPFTRKSYQRVIDTLTKFAGPTATIRDLPDVLTRYRQKCLSDTEAPKNRTVVKTRMILLSFARSTQKDGTSSDLYIAIKKVETAPAGRKRPMNAMMVWQVRGILSKLPERWKNVAWAMVCLGMGETEYRSGFDVLEDRVIVHGSKNDNRKRRTVPKISTFKKERLPNVLHDFRKALSDASNGKVRPYDFRGTFRLWMKEAGIPDERARRYFGHVTQSVEQGYLTTNVDNFLRDDTQKLVQYLKDNWEPPKNKEREKPVEVFVPTF